MHLQIIAGRRLLTEKAGNRTYEERNNGVLPE
jgi:hypothetical protein